ncbi:MAG: chaperone NapD [Oleispira antarctica]|uniref:Chaperone NapD n=1 Tax=Oleispira antarctica RB-8 TaxID=698738 RepID=R4YKW6_OLEAN|nr:chaperone NapD [Oleispira antarctica]MBQ0791160.1 chaperone NapD [Oleispira antarctica]CCK75286.1 Nitrate reductase accessory periplasmic protein NapD [Oleispira antarctica RB-8]
MRTNKIALDDVTAESHISSFIVFCKAEKHQAVEKALQAQADLEIHGSDEKGKFVIVTEAKHQGIILDRIDLISAIDGVVNTSMVYHQVAALDELDDEIDEADIDQPIEKIYEPQMCEAPSDKDAASHTVQ